MSAADKHRAQAEHYLNRAYYDGFEYAALANASALLAIEARLGELVDAQHMATLLAGSAYGLTDLSVVRRLVESLGQTMTGTSPGEPSVSITIADDMTAEQIQDALARARQRRDTGTFGGL